MDRTLQVELEADPVLNAAAEWFCELRSDSVTGERIAEWQQWLTRATAHREAFERIESFWHLSDAIQTPQWPTDLEVARDTYSGTQGVASWKSKQNRTFRPRLAAAASIAILGVGTILLKSNTGPEMSVTTAVGETRTLTLPDGSILAAGGRTSLLVIFQKQARSIKLEQGEAFFQVAKDSNRPFTVQAGNTSVTAVGTAFDVRKDSDRVVVAVAEGSVRVQAAATAPSQIKAGQRISVIHRTAAPELSPIDTRGVAQWRQGKLQYMDEPLEVVVGDLSRYTTRRISLDSPEVGALRVTSVVFERNVDAWLASLAATLPIEVVNHPDGSVSLKSRDGTQDSSP